LSCGYCGRELTAPFVGNTTTHFYHRYNAADARRIKAEHRVYFESEEQARAAQFRPKGEQAAE
jgi:hypothetical protein